MSLLRDQIIYHLEEVPMAMSFSQVHCVLLYANSQFSVWWSASHSPFVIYHTDKPTQRYYVKCNCRREWENYFRDRFF